MNILSSFTHPHILPNLCEFLSYVEHEDILKNAGNETVLSPLTYSIYFPTMEVSGNQQLFGFQNSSKYLLLCST